MKLSQKCEDSGASKSPVCSLFSFSTSNAQKGDVQRFPKKTGQVSFLNDKIGDIKTDRDDGHDTIECMRSPAGEDESVEMSMKSAILSSDEYSSTTSDSDAENSEQFGSKKAEKKAQTSEKQVKHKPPKPRKCRNSGETVELDTDHKDMDSLPSVAVATWALSTDNKSRQIEDGNTFSTQSYEMESAKMTHPKVSLLKRKSKKRASFGSIKDEYFEDHWDAFWKAEPEDEVQLVTCPDRSISLRQEKTDSQKFTPKEVTARKNSKDEAEEVDEITTSTPFQLLRKRLETDTMGSSSEDFSLRDSENSSDNSAQEAILRAIAILENSENSRSCSIEIQSITSESANTESSRTSEWESEVSSSESFAARHFEDISKASSIDEIAEILSKTCIQHAIRELSSQYGRQCSSPSDAFIESRLVPLPHKRCDSPAPVAHLSGQFHKYLTERNLGGVLRGFEKSCVRKSSLQNQIDLVPFGCDQALQNGNKKREEARVSNLGKTKIWEWNNSFISKSVETPQWEVVEEMFVVEQVAESIVKPSTHVNELIVSDAPPQRRDDAKLMANPHTHADECSRIQNKFFPNVNPNTPTPVKRRRSFFPDITGDLEQPEESSDVTPKVRFFKSPVSPREICKTDIVPDSCDRSRVMEKLPMVYHLGVSTPIFAKNCEFTINSSSEYYSSPVIPYLRGKVSTADDVLQESPESGRCSREMNVSDPQSVESNVESNHASESSCEMVKCSLEESDSPDSTNSGRESLHELQKCQEEPIPDDNICEKTPRKQLSLEEENEGAHRQYSLSNNKEISNYKSAVEPLSREVTKVGVSRGSESKSKNDKTKDVLCENCDRFALCCHPEIPDKEYNKDIQNKETQPVQIENTADRNIGTNSASDDETFRKCESQYSNTTFRKRDDRRVATAATASDDDAQDTLDVHEEQNVEDDKEQNVEDDEERRDGGYEPDYDNHATVELIEEINRNQVKVVDNSFEESTDYLAVKLFEDFDGQGGETAESEDEESSRNESEVVENNFEEITDDRADLNNIQKNLKDEENDIIKTEQTLDESMKADENLTEPNGRNSRIIIDETLELDENWNSTNSDESTNDSWIAEFTGKKDLSKG